MEVTIHRADADDATSLDVLRAQALKAAFQTGYDRKTVGELVATVDSELASRIDDDRYLVVVAETEITIVAYAVADRQDGELLSIMTSPDYQRSGFASAVLDRIETRVADAGHETLSAIVPDPALAFFQVRGFDPVETTTWHDLPASRVRKSL